MKNSVVLFLVILLLSFESGNAQQFGGFPPYFRWKQINSDTSRIIFQGAAAEQAERIATIIHRMAADTSFQLGSDIRKIDVLLHNRSTTANAFVALGPFRSEFYLVPGSSIFDFGNVAWQENLAIHEYRHVQQYSNFNNGLTKVFSFLLGEQGQDFANALTIPNWFFEGDAVFAETVFSPQGRGRLPYFLSGYKSLFAEGKNYSWMKLRNGSFKDYIPNHYQLGYILADYGYANYGADFWKQVTRDASGFKGLIYPFQKAVKKYAGIDFKAFRTAALNAENKKVQQERDVSTSKSKVVTNYFYPQFISTDSLIYLKSAFNKIPAFYILSGGKETKIALQNISQEEWFSYRSGMIAYTAFSTHPRWSLLNYSDIILLDIHSGKERKLTSKGRYYTPDLSPSLEKIVAVKMNDSLQSELRLIDITDGSTRALFPPNETDFFIQPRFVEENKIVVSVRNQQSQIALKLLDISTGKWEEIIPYSHHTTGLPFVSGSSIYFVSNLNGNDDVFSYDIKTKIISQLTADQTGNYYPAVSGDAIVWSHFTTSGLQLKRESLNGLQRRELAGSAWSRQPSVHVPAFSKNILTQETKRYAHKRYAGSTGLFNFHSWRPDYSDPEFTFSVYSDNILSTFSNELFYRYNQNETSHGIGWNTAYGALFPVLTAGAEYVFNRSFNFRQNQLDLNQVEARVGYQLPLNFTNGNYFRFLNLGSNFVFNRVMPTGFYKDSFVSENSTYLHHFLNFTHVLPRAIQHIFPKFGWNGSLQHRHLTSREGFQFVGNGNLFLPSFGNHSIVLNGMIQETDTSNVTFSNRFAMSRGYSDYYFSRMWKLAANYHLPVLYPDFGFANIAYLMRVRANIFYDLSRVYADNKLLTRDFRSAGTEIFFDTKWWNQLPVSFGFRISRLLDDGLRQGEGKGAMFYEFILPVGLIPN